MARKPRKPKGYDGRIAGQNRAWQEGKLAPNMYELARSFGSERACEEAMLDRKFPDGFVCPRCGHAEYARVGGRREFRRAR